MHVCVHVRAFLVGVTMEKAVEESNSRVLASIKDKEMSQWLPPPGEEDTSTVQDLLNTLS